MSAAVYQCCLAMPLWKLPFSIFLFSYRLSLFPRYSSFFSYFCLWVFFFALLSVLSDLFYILPSLRISSTFVTSKLTYRQITHTHTPKPPTSLCEAQVPRFQQMPNISSPSVCSSMSRLGLLLQQNTSENLSFFFKVKCRNDTISLPNRLKMQVFS